MWTGSYFFFTDFIKRRIPRRFGIAIRPLKISDKVHTQPAEITAPEAAAAAYKTVKKGDLLLPNTYLKAVSPQKYQPITVHKAKIPISAAVNGTARQPMAFPIASAGEKFSEPHNKVTAVSVQHTIVSKNTSNIAHIP